MKPKTFVLVKCNKYEFSFMADAIYCYFMVQKKPSLYQSFIILFVFLRLNLLTVTALILVFFEMGLANKKYADAGQTSL